MNVDFWDFLDTWSNLVVGRIHSRTSVGSVMLGFLILVWVILYTCARIYLITEAFISVRSLPLGAYETVTWVSLLPHLGSN